MCYIIMDSFNEIVPKKTYPPRFYNNTEAFASKLLEKSFKKLFLIVIHEQLK